MRVILIILLILLTATPVRADQYGWVMCQPDSSVNIRGRPSKGSAPVATGFMGDRITLDGKRKGKWLHCIIPCEAGEGWIREDFVSLDPPEDVGSGVFRVDKNNTFARYSKGGKKRIKLSAGTEVRVFMVTESWCVTSQGFIKTECLTCLGSAK